MTSADTDIDDDYDNNDDDGDNPYDDDGDRRIRDGDVFSPAGEGAAGAGSESSAAPVRLTRYQGIWYILSYS